MDLSPFCGKDELRPYLCHPFSSGEWTYATDGYILVRVLRRDTVPDNANAPDAEKLFASHPGGKHYPLPAIEFPEINTTEPCRACDGRGTDHDCPGCTCSCVDCGGTGFPKRGWNTSVQIGKCMFDARFILLLRQLSGVELTLPQTPSPPSHFRFYGGEGLLMPINGRRENHIVVDIAHPLPPSEPMQ